MSRQRSTMVVRGTVLLAVLAGMAAAGCSLRDQILFDDPAAEVVLIGEVNKWAVAGGTMYSGSAINNGGLDAENVYVHVTVYNAGGGAIGTYSGPVVYEYNDEDGAVTTLEPDTIGAFTLTVPVGYSAIASETVTFSWTEPVEEEEE